MRVCLMANLASIHTRRWSDASIAAGHNLLIISPEPFPSKYPNVFVYEKTPTRIIIVRLWRRALKVVNSLYLLYKHWGVGFIFKYWRDLFDVSRGLGTNPRDIARVQQKIREFQPDIIHIHYIGLPLYQWLFLSAFPKTKLVVTVWGDDIEEQTFRHSPLSRLLKRKILLRADIVTAASKRLANLTSAYAPVTKKMKIIPFGVDLTRFKPRVVRPRNKVMLGSIRHLQRTYGIDLMIRAASLLKSKSWELVIAGDGDASSYKELAKDLKVADRVRFLGEVKYSKVPKVLKSLDLFMMPSRWETFGVAAVEAQACGLPVVGTKVGGIPEVVSDGRTGYLVQRGDYQSLAKKIDELINDPDTLIRMSKEAPLWVAERFDWAKNTQAMFNLYKQLIPETKK